MNTDIESLSPLIDCFVYCTLQEGSPRAHQPLPQLCHVMYWRVVDSFLHHSSNAVINKDYDPGCWTATCREPRILESYDEVTLLFDVHDGPVH